MNRYDQNKAYAKLSKDSRYQENVTSTISEAHWLDCWETMKSQIQIASTYLFTYIPMTPSILSYISGILTLLILDGVMIWFVVLPTFKRYIPSYLNTEMNLPAAIAFYLLYILVLLFLVILPWVEDSLTISRILTNSALLGFGAYMTYELTSMTVMKGWSWNMVMIDVLWGTFLTMIIGAIMFTVYRYFI